MIFLYIHLGISVLTLLLSILAVIDISFEFKRRYPTAVFPKKSWASGLFSWVRFTIASFVPLMNIGLCLVYTFSYKSLQTRVLNELYIDYLREERGRKHEEEVE